MAGARPGFGFIFASTIVSAVAFGLIIPILPAMLRALEGGDAGRAAQWMMLFASTFGLAQFVCAPILGALSDRFGRRPVLLVSNLGLAADFLFMTFAPNAAWLLAGRLVGGATAATVAVANAYVADITPPAERAAAFGRLGSALAFGFLAGPVLGGVLGEIDLRLPFLVAAGLTLLNALYGILVLPESLPPAARASTIAWRGATPLGALRLLRSRGDLPALALVGLLAALANAIWGSVWVLYCAHRFGWSPAAMGLQIMAAGVLGLVVQARLVGPITRRLGDPGALVLGAAIGAAALAWAGLSPSGLVFLVSMPLAALGLVFQPALDALLTRRADPEGQGQLQGATKSLNAIAIVVGPTLYGATFAWSLTRPGPDLSGLPLFLAAGFMTAAALVAWGVRRREVASP